MPYQTPHCVLEVSDYTPLEWVTTAFACSSSGPIQSAIERQRGLSCEAGPRLSTWWYRCCSCLRTGVQIQFYFQLTRYFCYRFDRYVTLRHRRGSPLSPICLDLLKLVSQQVREISWLLLASPVSSALTDSVGLYVWNYSRQVTSWDIAASCVLRNYRWVSFRWCISSYEIRCLSWAVCWRVAYLASSLSVIQRSGIADHCPH